MRKLGLVALVSLMAVGLAPAALAQGYEPPTHANPKDVYCSGFIAASDYPRDLYLIGGWDAAGRLTYAQYDYVYINRGADGGLQPGQRYLVVRRYDQEFTDWDPVEAFPKQKEMLKAMGKIYIDIGQVEVAAVNPDTATAMVTANSKNSVPMVPGISITGTKAATSTSVVDRMAVPTCLAPRSAARSGGSFMSFIRR